MENLKRAHIKKMRKMFKVGDWVTWGNARVANQVVEVPSSGIGLYVNAYEWSRHFPRI